jgi:hypothetical protein
VKRIIAESPLPPSMPATSANGWSSFFPLKGLVHGAGVIEGGHSFVPSGFGWFT